MKETYNEGFNDGFKAGLKEALAIYSKSSDEIREKLKENL